MKNNMYKKRLPKNKKTGVYKDKNDNLTFYKNGLIHRDNDNPAIIYSNGSKSWFRTGYLYRGLDKPAVIKADGSRCWYKNNEIHRENGKPAIIEIDGTKKWYKNGWFQRKDNKPVITSFDDHVLFGHYQITKIPGKTKAPCYIWAEFQPIFLKDKNAYEFL